MVSIVVAILVMVFLEVRRPIDSNAGDLLQDAGRIESRGSRVRERYLDTLRTTEWRYPVIPGRCL